MQRPSRQVQVQVSLRESSAPDAFSNRFSTAAMHICIIRFCSSSNNEVMVVVVVVAMVVVMELSHDAMLHRIAWGAQRCTGQWRLDSMMQSAC